MIIPEEIKIEGGDIIIHNDFIFIGYSDDNSYKVSRTSPESIQFIQKHFPDKEVLGFNLIKDDDDPYKSVLHLDCAMQPVYNYLNRNLLSNFWTLFHRCIYL